ncbi:MAG: molybdopterin-dependent oxidoreductase [Candidatus Marinimicrobia bacterium]|nr:molybdopterin-dependent oxidoreductase [Candidatus Neomarinimicrobiota bacterium]
MSEKKVISRRKFLQISGLASGSAAIGVALFSQTFGLSEKAINILRTGPGKESWRVTACRLCPGGCSLSIKRIDGIPINLKGNPLSPINRGGTCPAAYANLEILYHPDRFTEPFARPAGPLRKELSPVSWDEILSSISDTINDLIERNQPYKIAIINGDDSPMMQEAWRNFANWVGTPNYFQEKHSGYNSNSSYITQGMFNNPKYDLINSDCIISLGADFLEEGAPVHFNQVLSQFKDVENITRNKMIYVGPRANITATSAHKWLPITPDTWGTLALGIAHILIDEHYVDLDYFRRNSPDFSDWVDENGIEHTGFENLIRSEFHPKRVEEITGISESNIIELTELIHNRKTPVIMCGQEALQSPRGELHEWAVHCLNFLIGSIQRPGGWYFTDKENIEKLYTQKYTGQDVQNLFVSDKNHPLEKPSLDIFAKRVEGYSPYQIELLIINKANPVYYGENRRKWKTLLKHIPRVIFIGDLPNDTSHHADVILPAHSEFENWDLVEDIPGVIVKTAVLQRPVINHMYNTKSSYSILKSFSDGIKSKNTRFLNGIDSKSFVKERLQKIYQSKQGQLYTSQTQKEWKDLYSNHRSMKISESEKKFMKNLLKVGGWWDPSYDIQLSLKDIIKNPHGQFTFLKNILKSFQINKLDESQFLKDLLAKKSYPKNYEEYNTSKESGFPLTLVSGYPITNPYGRTVYSPTMVETMGIIREIFWENWVEINPETAVEHEVEDGMMIRIDSSVGMIHARVRVRPIIHPNTVYIPMGLGRENVGRFTSNKGSDPRELMVSQPEIFTGNTILSGTPVKITLI